MTQRVLMLLTCLFLGLFLLTQPGCLLLVAAGATGGTVAYVRGDLESSVDAAPDAIADATERAMKGMNISVISKQSTSLDATIVGRTASDVKLTVQATAETSGLSHISVRAGVFGDDVMQANLLEKIRQELGQAKTASTDVP